MRGRDYEEYLKDDKIPEYLRHKLKFICTPQIIKDREEFIKNHKLENDMEVLLMRPECISIPDILKDDEKFILSIDSKYASVRLSYASDRLRNNKQFVLSIIKNEPSNYTSASEELKKDEDVVFSAAERDYTMLDYAPSKISDNLKKDKNFISKAIAFNPKAILYASNELRKDKDFITPLILKNSSILECLPENTLLPEIIAQNRKIYDSAHACIVPSECLQKYLAFEQRKEGPSSYLNYQMLMVSHGSDLSANLTYSANQQSCDGMQNESTKLEYCLIFKTKKKSVDRFLTEMIKEFGVNSKNYCANLAKTNHRFADHINNWTMFKTPPTGSGSRHQRSALKPFAYAFKDENFQIAPPQWEPQSIVSVKRSQNEIELQKFWKDRPLGGFFFSKEMIKDIVAELDKWNFEKD